MGWVFGVAGIVAGFVLGSYWIGSDLYDKKCLHPHSEHPSDQYKDSFAMCDKAYNFKWNFMRGVKILESYSVPSLQLLEKKDSR